MYVDSVGRTKFFIALHKLDLDLAACCRQERCRFCGGPLHDAGYDRKPRGGPTGLPDEVCRRLSLCCGREGCRRRTLPPSCLFVGRKVYWAAIILVTVALRQRRPGSASAAKLRTLFGVSWDTVKRWMTYFAEVFPRSDGWKRCRGAVPVSVRDEDLPAGLLDLFIQESGSEETGLVRCLELLAGGWTSAVERGR